MKKILLSMMALAAITATAQQTTVIDTTKVESLDEVLVRSVRVKADSPITHSNLTKAQIAQRNLGQDIATQLNFLPSVVTTSDAGAGIGYTGFRVRGTGNQGINVTINGIPYNDAESATTFFVNLQDFSSSVESLQLQRGVGSSTNGPGAFGASLNILTDAISKEAYGEISNSSGSFATRRHNVKFSTGLLNDHIEISGRLSQIKSDGYIDRASSDLKSYFLQAAYTDDNTLVKLINFAGFERTYQSWFGFEPFTTEVAGFDPNIEKNRTFNVAGIQLDNSGNFEGFYQDQVDNYNQDHYQLHWNQKYDNRWSSQVSFNYTYGRGYFEEYVDSYFYPNAFFDNSASYAFFGLDPITINGQEVTETDLIRRRWLDNDFYVLNATVNYNNRRDLDLTLGVYGSIYEGDHFGEIIWSEFPLPFTSGDRYYDGSGSKNEISSFIKGTFEINERVQAYGDLQLRAIDYTTDGINSDLDSFIVDENYLFFNPKAGVTFKYDDRNQFYTSYARASREPNRTDFENGSPEAEKLDDFELGWRYASDKIALQINAYYMDYKGQLIATGELDDVGAPIRVNSNSYRAGVEIDAAVKINNLVSLLPNIALSLNKNRDFLFTFDEEVNGENQSTTVNLGNTDIAYSPGVVASNMIKITPAPNFSINILSKYVGEQFLGNVESDGSLLNDYFINDLNVTYEITGVPVFKSIALNALVNNIFDVDYISNGYAFTLGQERLENSNRVNVIQGAGFYPQAGINFLVGATMKF